MRAKNLTQQHLFIINSHNSYMTINFITFCMKCLINLCILLPHTSHLIQLLNVGIFAPLKHILNKKPIQFQSSILIEFHAYIGFQYLFKLN